MRDNFETLKLKMPNRTYKNSVMPTRRVHVNERLYVLPCNERQYKDTNKP